jgi:hypothetical protein
MKRFALGCLGYDMERFGIMRVGDFLDAMAGFNERENERIKTFAELLRVSTSILWNVQVGRKDKLKAKDLMPLPWDKKDIQPVVFSEEEMKKGFELFDKILNQGGDNNIKP